MYHLIINPPLYNKNARNTSAVPALINLPKRAASLKGDEAKNPKCLKCHSTAASVDQGLVTSITVEEGVSCESCHGPGSLYKVATTMKDMKLAMSKGLIMPDEKVCKKCHNEGSPNYKGFNFKEYSAKIAHTDPTKK